MTDLAKLRRSMAFQPQGRLWAVNDDRQRRSDVAAAALPHYGFEPYADLLNGRGDLCP